MRVLRIVLAMLIIGGLLSAIEISSNKTKRKSEMTSVVLRPTKADLNERLVRPKASRASSERSAVVSADTTTFKDTLEWSLATVPETTTTTMRRPPKRMTTVRNTAPPTTATIEQSAENPPGDNYGTCLAAAASVKGNKIAPNVARWTHLVEQYFPNEIYKTCRVMACESGGNPGAVGPRQPNGTYPQGLMQILSGPFDPEANMALAASMRAKRGWQPWACK